MLEVFLCPVLASAGKLRYRTLSCKELTIFELILAQSEEWQLLILWLSSEEALFRNDFQSSLQRKSRLTVSSAERWPSSTSLRHPWRRAKPRPLQLWCSHPVGPASGVLTFCSAARFLSGQGLIALEQ